MFLVDGYNALRRVGSLSGVEAAQGLEAGREALLRRILESGVLNGDSVEVVFDGAAGPGSRAGRSVHRRLTVRYAPDADEAISRRVERLDARRRDRVTVITADAELAWRVKSFGARVLAPEAWPALTSGKQKGGKSRRAPSRLETSEKPRASKAEVDYWLEIFGNED